MRDAHRSIDPRYQPGKTTRLGLVLAYALMTAACGSGGGDSPSASPAQTSVASAPAAAPSPTPAAGTPASAPAAAPAPDAFAQDLLDRVNAVRATAHACGGTTYPAAPPLTWNTDAEQAARTQALYLQGNNLFTHTGAGGSSVGDRLTAAGYAWNAVGENIAAGYPDAASVVAGWVASPGHCANLSNAAYADLGVALQPGTGSNTYSDYWVMVVAHAR